MDFLHQNDEQKDEQVSGAENEGEERRRYDFSFHQRNAEKHHREHPRGRDVDKAREAESLGGIQFLHAVDPLAAALPELERERGNDEDEKGSAGDGENEPPLVEFIVAAHVQPAGPEKQPVADHQRRKHCSIGDFERGLDQAAIFDRDRDEEFVWAETEAEIGESKLEQRGKLVADFDQRGGRASQDDAGNSIDDCGGDEDVKNGALDEREAAHDRAERQHEPEGEADDAGETVWQIESRSQPFETVNLFNWTFHLFIFCYFEQEYHRGCILCSRQTRAIRRTRSLMNEA